MTQPDPITLTPIGLVHCRLKYREETPRNFDISTETATLEIFPAYAEALAGIEPGQTIVVLFWLHEARRDLLRVYPRGGRSRGLQGVFATRSPVRPNPVAISELKVSGIEGNLLKVSGVDVYNDTPILDIKKKMEKTS